MLSLVLTSGQHYCAWYLPSLAPPPWNVLSCMVQTGHPSMSDYTVRKAQPMARTNHWFVKEAWATWTHLKQSVLISKRPLSFQWLVYLPASFHPSKPLPRSWPDSPSRKPVLEDHHTDKARAPTSGAQMGSAVRLQLPKFPFGHLQNEGQRTISEDSCKSFFSRMKHETLGEGQVGTSACQVLPPVTFYLFS